MKRAISTLSIVTCLAGCFPDDSALSGGARSDAGLDGAGFDGGGGADGPPAMDAADAGGDTCDDFAGDATGGAAAGWTASTGTWMVVASGATHAYAQSTAFQGADNFYAASWVSQSTADSTTTATLKVAGGNGRECVVARFVDADNFYALCLRNGSSWELLLLHAGVVTTLGSGALTYAAASTHVLALQVAGTKLSATVDGTAEPDATDATLATGASGVASETTSAYTRVCVRR